VTLGLCIAVLIVSLFMYVAVGGLAYRWLKNRDDARACSDKWDDLVLLASFLWILALIAWPFVAVGKFFARKPVERGPELPKAQVRK
jgi:hypothetical protein